MQHTRNSWATAILSSLIVLALVSIAAAQAAAPMGGDPVANRQRLMKLVGANWADIQAKVKAGNTDAVAVNAETIAVMATHIPSFFPAGSATDVSNAKPEIWEKWADFQAAAKTLESMAENLRDASRAKDGAAVEAAVKEFGAKACGACHTPFRKPPKS
jgi:cytochrome c556